MNDEYLKRIVVIFLALIAAPLGIWQAVTTMKNPLYRGINDENNTYVQNAAFVREVEGFREGNMVLVELFFRGSSPTPRILKKIEEHTIEYAAGTGGIILGPTNCPQINEDEVGPYLPFYGVTEAEMPLWWQKIKHDPLCGQLIASDGISTSAYLLLIPPGPYTQSFHRTLANTLEHIHPKGFWECMGKEIQWLFWKNDIEPLAEKGMEIYVISFSIGEAVVERGINQDIMALKFPIGLFCFAGLYLIISFRFLHQNYGPVLLSIILTIEWTFGAIGALAPFGFHHTIYSVIPLGGGASVMGLSFAVQKMEAFLTAKGEHTKDRWGEAGKTIHLSMLIIVLFTALAFVLFLGNFAGLQRMKEIGMFFACAALIAWLNARIFLPIIHYWWTELFGERDEKDLWQWQKTMAIKLDDVIVALVKWIWNINVTLCHHAWRRRLVQGAPLLVFTVAVFLFYGGNIITISAIEAFLPDGSKTEEAFLRAKEQKGYSPLQIMVSAAFPNALTNERFIEATQKLLENVEKIEKMGMVLSPLQGILHQRAQRTLPDTVRVVEEGEDMVDTRMRSYLHTRSDIVILAFHPMIDSAAIRKAINAIEAYGGKIEATYRDLGITVRVWGDPTLFAEMARRVPKQTPWNVLTSLLFVFGSYTIVVASLNRWYQTRSVSSFWGGWTLSQSFMLATGVTGCVMALCGIPLNIATAPISEVAIAAAADFNVYLAIAFLLFLYRELPARIAMQDAFEEKAETVIKDYIGNSLCFILLISSSLQPVAELGLLMIINLFVCVAWGLFMTLPMLTANAEKRKEVVNEHDTFDYMRAASLLG